MNHIVYISTTIIVLTTVATDELSDPCNSLDVKICADANNTCYANSGKITCSNKCEVYNMATNPACETPEIDLKLIYLEGTCMLSDDGTPVCEYVMRDAIYVAGGGTMKNAP